MTERQQGLDQNSTIQQGAFLVYIAGVHVPATSVSINFSVMSFPEASIQLPADNNLLKIGEEDRVPVAIFFLDRWYSSTDPTTVGVTPTWRLLFDGDITQWGYQRTAYSRFISINAIAHNSILNYMSILYLDGKSRSQIENLSIAKAEAIAAARMSSLQTISFFTKGAYGTGDIKKPIDFVKNLLIGMKIGGSPKKGVGVPTTSTSNDDQVTKVEKTLYNVSSSSVSSENFKDLRVNLNIPVSAASEFFIKYNHRNKIDKRWIASSIEDVTLQASGSQNSEAYSEEELQSSLVKAPVEEDVGAATTTTTGNTVEVIKDDLFIAKMKEIQYSSIVHQFTQKRSPYASFWSLVDEFYSTILYRIIHLPTAQYVHVDENEIPSTKDRSKSRERLGSAISVPNLSFALSPACNVITPAMVESFTFQEDYAVQNTRVIADGSLLFPGKTKGAVVTAALRFGYPTDQNRVLEGEHSTKRSPDNILIYPEEYFKGPVVSRPKAPSHFLTLEQASMYERRKNKSDGDSIAENIAKDVKSKDPKETDKASTVSARHWRQELLYGFTKSYYLENKYSARQGSIDMVFNPYIIPGMTFTLIDGDEFDKFHLTGLVTSVNISMSNASVSTSLSYTSGRTLKEVYEQVFTENTFGPDIGIADRNEDSEEVDIYTTAPIMPIRSMADELQTDVNANKFFHSLLYSNEVIDSTKDYVFKNDKYFRSTVGSDLVKAKNNKTKIGSDVAKKIEGKNFPGTVSELGVTKKTYQTLVGDGQAVSIESLSTFKVDVDILDSETSNINDYELSMRRASRPICSIAEYMAMFNTTNDLNQIKNITEKDGEFGIEYPIQLRLYVIDEVELGDNFIRPTSKEGGFTDTSSELRRNWPKKMLEYRARVKANSILGR